MVVVIVIVIIAVLDHLLSVSCGLQGTINIGPVNVLYLSLLLLPVVVRAMMINSSIVIIHWHGKSMATMISNEP